MAYVRTDNNIGDLGFAWAAIPAIISGVLAVMKNVGSVTTKIDYGHMWPHFQAVGGDQWLDQTVSTPVSSAWGVDHSQFKEQFQNHWPFSGVENPPLDTFFNAVGNLVQWAVSVGGHPDVGVLLDAFDRAEIMIETRWQAGPIHKTSYEKFATVKSKIIEQMGGSTQPPGGTQPTQQAGFSLSGIAEMFKNPIVLGATAFIFLMMFGSGKQRQPQVIYLPK